MPIDIKPAEPKSEIAAAGVRSGQRRISERADLLAADLAPGARISGPAVIAEDDTSTVVSPLFDARIDRFGYIELTRREN